MANEEFVNEYECYFDENMEKICEDKNVVIIADRPKETYIYIIIEKLNTFDQVELHALDAYKDKTEFLVKFFEAIGVLPVKGYPLRKEEEIPLRGSKKTYKNFANIWVITKIPELSRFFDEGEKKVSEDKNVVVIAGMPEKVYAYIMMEKFQRFDQVEIQVIDAYVKKAISLIKFFEGMGILPITNYPLRFEKVEVQKERWEEENKDKFKMYVNRITLTKIPQLYKYTHN